MNSSAKAITIPPTNDDAPSAGARGLLVLRLDQVIVPENRLRLVKQEQVRELVRSISQVGQITPIEVGPVEDGRYELVAGEHRLTAIRQLGYATIEAVVFEGSAQHRRMREIDENLFKNTLNPLDQAISLAERAVLYKQLFPQAKHGGDRRSDQVCNLHTWSKPRAFADDVAAATGLNRTTVTRALQRATGIHADARSLIRGTWIADKASALDQLRDVAQDRQVDVVRALLSDDPKRPRTVRAARQYVLAELTPPPPDPVDMLFARIKVLPPGDRAALVERMAGAGWCSKSRKAAVA